MTSIFRSIVHSSIRRSIQVASFVQQVLSNTWVFLTGTADFTFTRTGDQFGIAANGDLVLSTQDVSAHIFDEGVLLELFRTNAQIRSQELDDAAWSKTNITVTADAGADSLGGTTADLLIPSAILGSHFFVQNTPVTSGVTYTQSLDVEAGGYGFVQITGSAGFALNWANVNLSTGLVGNSNLGTAKIKIKTLPSGRYRISYTDVATSTVSGRFVCIPSPTDMSARNESFTGDGVSGVFFSAAQFEAGSFPSSYIPTLGATASRATTDMRRLWPFPANGISFQAKPFQQFDATDDKGSDLIIVNLSDGTEDNYLRATYDQTNDQIHLKKRVSGGTEVVISTAASALNYVKGTQRNVRIVADENGLGMWVDGLVKVSTTAGDATTPWATLMTTIEEGASFQAMESSGVWNLSQPDSFMENLT